MKNTTDENITFFSNLESQINELKFIKEKYRIFIIKVIKNNEGYWWDKKTFLYKIKEIKREYIKNEKLFTTETFNKSEILNMLNFINLIVELTFFSNSDFFIGRVRKSNKFKS